MNHNQKTNQSRKKKSIWIAVLVALVLFSTLWLIVNLRQRGEAKTKHADPFGDATLVLQEIRYHMPEASEVYFVWGIDGWSIAPEELRPEQTEIKNELMHTKMKREQEEFVIRIRVPIHTKIGYGFLITTDQDGDPIGPIWDGQNYFLIAFDDRTRDINPSVELPEKLDATEISPDILVTTEFRYDAPNAEDVFLVWGRRKWATLPRELRPTGTTIKNRVMHTPMIQENEVFVTRTRTLIGEEINYGFLVSEKDNLNDKYYIWDYNKKYKIIPIMDSIKIVKE